MAGRGEAGGQVTAAMRRLPIPSFVLHTPRSLMLTACVAETLGYLLEPCCIVIIAALQDFASIRRCRL